MNFLQLAQRVARESGTIPGDSQPSSVTSQTGRLQSLINWTNTAWEEIQSRDNSWLWMQSTFSGTTISGTGEYAADALGITSRFSHWMPVDADGYVTFSIYPTADGAMYERPLRYVTYDQFYRNTQGIHENDLPQMFAITPAGNIILHPTPDAEYTIRGRYMKSPQTLSANTDIPEMPERHHMLIVWEALLLLAQFDEAVTQFPMWGLNARKLMGELQSLQLPQIRMPGPLA
jgi:hypothetical protein